MADYVLDSIPEVTRLQEQQDLIVDALGGQLVLAPVDWASQPLRILDSGTTDGYFLRALAQSLPNGSAHRYTGTDVNPAYFPGTPAPDTQYAVQDVTKPWVPAAAIGGPFDLVHQRLVLSVAGAASPATAVSNLVAQLKPGGWIQIIEPAFADPVHGGGPSPNGPAMDEFLALTARLAGMNGSSTDFRPEKLREWLVGAGVEEPETRVVRLKLGATNPDAQLAAKGIRTATSPLVALAGMRDKLPDAFPFSADELAGLARRLSKELVQQGGYLGLYVAWGRKKA